MARTQQLCTFLLDGLLFGVDVMNVQEVIRLQDMTPVPLTSAIVRGLINLRGQIVTAIDMRPRLSLPDRAKDAEPMNVVVRTTDGVVSLLVDEIGDVLEVSDDAWERSPETMTAQLRDVVSGVYKLPGRLLLSLDVERVATAFSAARGGRAEAFA